MEDTTNPADDKDVDTAEGGDDSSKDTSKSDDDSSKEDKSTPAKDAEDKKPPSDNDGDPPVRRKDSKDFIIKRQQDRIKKLEETKEKDSDASPDDPVSRSEFDSFRQAQEEQQAEDSKSTVELEVEQFVADNPHFKEFASQIKRFAVHPSRIHLPIKTIAFEVAGDKLLELGAKKRQEADSDADKTKSGGSTGGADNSANKGKQWNKMTPEEFQKAKGEEMADLRR